MNKEFLEFWALYPRKIGKVGAWRSWQKMDKEYLIGNGKFKEVMEALENQKELFSKDKKFIPHPQTWLNQGRWMDQIDDEIEEPSKWKVV